MSCIATNLIAVSARLIAINSGTAWRWVVGPDHEIGADALQAKGSDPGTYGTRCSMADIFENVKRFYRDNRISPIGFACRHAGGL